MISLKNHGDTMSPSGDRAPSMRSIGGTIPSEAHIFLEDMDSGSDAFEQLGIEMMTLQ